MRKLLLAVLLLAAGPAWADDMVRPDFLDDYVASHQPAGHATFRKLLFKVYDANFWSDVDYVDYDKPFALSLTYDVSIESKDFVDKTMEEMAHVTGKPEADFTKWRGALGKAFPTVKRGDTITALYIPPDKARFYFNGKQTNEVRDRDFPQQFFGIWLSPNTSEPDFRQALLNTPS